MSRPPRSYFERAVDWRPSAPLSRRSLLGGVVRGSLVTLALPPLQAMFNASGTAYACDGVLPKRFGLWYWGNGNVPDRWTPTGTGDGDAWVLSEELSPLALIKHKICVVSGLAVKLPNTAPHSSGCAGMLSASPLQSTGDDETFSAPSIDQVIAAQVGGASLYRSIQTAATDCSGRSYNGPNSQNPPEIDPFAFYERIFGDTFVEPGEDGIVDPRLGLRRSVLDAVMGDIQGLQKRLGSADRQRLEQHLDGVRELEQRLTMLQENPPNLESCSRAEAPKGSFEDIDGRPQIPLRNDVMSRMLAMTLACDQTRVFAHFLSDPVADVLYEGTTAGHHSLTHDEPAPQDQVNEITLQIMEMLATSLQHLDAIPEGDGTLLDNCAILACSEVSLGQTHNIEEMPIVLAGGCCGFFKVDHHYRSLSGDNATKVLVTLQRAMDISLSSFGNDEAMVDEGLSDIEA